MQMEAKLIIHNLKITVMKYIMTIREGEFVVEVIKSDNRADLDLFICEDFSYDVENEDGAMLLIDASFSEAAEWINS